jgi:hypothetical protein
LHPAMDSDGTRTHVYCSNTTVNGALNGASDEANVHPKVPFVERTVSHVDVQQNIRPAAGDYEYAVVQLRLGSGLSSK